jgi:hypothetical protein
VTSVPEAEIAARLRAAGLRIMAPRVTLLRLVDETPHSDAAALAVEARLGRLFSYPDTTATGSAPTICSCRSTSRSPR